MNQPPNILMSNNVLPEYLRGVPVPSEFIDTPVKTAPIPAAFAPIPLKNVASDSAHTQTAFRKFDSDSSGVCSDISFHNKTPDRAPNMASMTSFPHTPRPNLVRINQDDLNFTPQNSSVAYNHMYSTPLPVTPPSSYADYEVSPTPKLPPQFADSDESPEHSRPVSKPIGLQAFSHKDGYISALNSASPKRHRLSSECQEEEEEKNECHASLLPALSEGSRCSSGEIDLLFSPSTNATGYKGDPLNDFEAVNIRWNYGCQVLTIADYAQDIYDMWRQAERTHGFNPGFLATQKDMSEEWRKEIWLNLLSFRRNMEITHETFHLAVYLFDKCLDTFYVNLDNAKDLAAVTLVIASKLEDYSPLKLNDVIIMDIVEHSEAEKEEKLKLKKISKLEKKVLNQLGYSLTFVTPFMFMNFFHQQLHSCLYTIQLSNYMLELCLLSTKYREVGGAFTAHAVVCLAKAIVGSTSIEETVTMIEQTEVLLSGAGRIDVGSTRGIMRLLLQDMQAATIEQHEVWQEYSNADRCSVSDYSLPYGLFDKLPVPEDLPVESQ